VAPLSDNARGALWMMASMAGFVLNDTLMKSVSGEVPLFQAIFVRGVIATGLIALLAWGRGALAHRPRGPDRKLMVYRMAGEIGGTSLFLTALFNMPLANATAIIQAAPLSVTLAAALFLGHAVGWRRYTAIGVGFLGVLLIVRPGSEGFNAYSLAALASVLFITLRDVSTRGLSLAVPSLFVTVITSLAITVFAGAVTAFGDWQPVGWEVVARLGGAAVLLLLGYYAGIVSMRVGEIGFVSPFRYTNLLWALLLGFAVFGDVPEWLTVAGASIVAGTGLYTLHRERITARRPMQGPAQSAVPATPFPASAACRDGGRPEAPARRERR
jgi:drug/metabolite transporter (DMT)-like permease